MIGIPFVIRRFSEHGVEDTTIYLRTRRTAMSAALRGYHDSMLAQSVAASRVAGIMARAMQAEQTGTPIDLQPLLAEQELALAESASQSRVAIDCAYMIATIALRENYSDQMVSDYVEMLTDRELKAIVQTVELGEMPKDFFTSAATPPPPPSTTPSGPSPASDSSKQDSPAGTLKKE